MPPKSPHRGNGESEPVQQQQQQNPAATAAADVAPTAAATPPLSSAPALLQPRCPRSHHPAWVFPTITALVAVILGLLGTVWMAVPAEEKAAAWESRDAVFHMEYWADLMAWSAAAARQAIDTGINTLAGGGGGGVVSGDKDSNQVAAPPALHTRQPPPPAVATGNVATSVPTTSAAPAPLTCYTLDTYSDTFIASEGQRRQGRRYFRCGTRVTDLRTEANVAVRAACLATPPDTTAAGNSSNNYINRRHLRVVLTAAEVDWHAKLRLNLGAQTVALSRLNDDYCDCLDGTDELLTAACSMAGPGMPLLLREWQQYVQSNGHIPLYEDQVSYYDPTPIATEKKKQNKKKPEGASSGLAVRNTALDPHTIGGPVLPFVCTGDPETLLSPSMVGDGIVDCCDGSDEAPRVWDRDDANSDGGGDTRQEAVLETWRRRQTANSHHNEDEDDDGEGGDGKATAVSAPYGDPLNPHVTTATALLVDRGYTALLTCPAVHRRRLRTARRVLAATRAAHSIFLQRERDGWDALGLPMQANQTKLGEWVANLTAESESVKRDVTRRMTAANTDDPRAAGVEPRELQYYEYLTRRAAAARQDLQHLSLCILQKVFGARYEYYPLFDRAFELPAGKMISSDASSAAAVRRAARARRVPVAGVIALHTAAQQYDKLMAQAREYGQEAEARETVPQPPPLHVDNITAGLLSVVTARLGFLEQRRPAERELEAVARARGALRHQQQGEQQQQEGEEEIPYDRAALEARYGDAIFAPPRFTLGHWQPFSVAQTARGMAVVDPSGDVALPRRLGVRPHSALTRGGGRLQRATRRSERERVVALVDSDAAAEKKQQQQQQRRGGGKDEDDDTFDVPILYHRNTPNIVATHRFLAGSLHCGLDGNRNSISGSGSGGTPVELTAMRVVYACAERDEVLVWARNGKCDHEVVMGTPSACARWVVAGAEEAVARLSRNLVDHSKEAAQA